MTKKMIATMAMIGLLICAAGCGTSPISTATPITTATANINTTSQITADPTQAAASASPDLPAIFATVTPTAAPTLEATTAPTATPKATKKPSATKTATKKPTAKPTKKVTAAPKPTATPEPEMKVMDAEWMAGVLVGINYGRENGLYQGIRGREPISAFDPEISEKCVEWAKKMAAEERIFHAEGEERDWLLEAVGNSSVTFNGEKTNESLGVTATVHTSGLMDSTIMGAGCVEYKGNYYICVRGN